MKVINIEIPDNLNAAQEAVAISKTLFKTALIESKKNEIKRIGSTVEIIDLHTQINIKRTSSDPVIKLVKCNVCNCEYDIKEAINYWHNYGGRPKKVNVCSKDCANVVLELLGERAAMTKYKLKPLNLFV